MTRWAQFDHILPHTRGRSNEIDNLVVTCAPCNFGLMRYALEAVGDLSILERAIQCELAWNGLERSA